MARDQLPAVIEPADDTEAMPALVADAGGGAAFAWEEYFSGEIRNPHTRRAYRHAVRRFLEWCDGRKLTLRRSPPDWSGSISTCIRAASLPASSTWRRLRGSSTSWCCGSGRPQPGVVGAGRTARGRRGQDAGDHPRPGQAAAEILRHRQRRGPARPGHRRTLIFTAARIGAVAGLKIGSLIQNGGGTVSLPGKRRQGAGNPGQARPGALYRRLPEGGGTVRCSREQPALSQHDRQDRTDHEPGDPAGDLGQCSNGG